MNAPTPSGCDDLVLRAMRPDDFEDVMTVWHSSVEATHDFLARDDIEFFDRVLREKRFAGVDMTIAERAGDVVAFMGMTGNDIDMLFVHDTARGQGIGTALIAHAATEHPVLQLTVNEQNPAARAFYESQGFIAVGRSELDGTGRPFPLIHMKREAAPLKP